MERESYFRDSREGMVREQLQSRGIKNEKVLDAFRKVERHRFIDPDLLEEAYEDHPVSIGHGQTISQPYIVALMTEILELCPEDMVLEIGTGSGYQAAILAELCKWVYSVERIGSLAKKAELTLKALGYRNFSIKIDDGTLGWEEFAPFDKIIVTAAAPSVPQTFIDQLKILGKMTMPVGGSFSQSLQLIEKISQDQIREEMICGCVFVPLIGKYSWKSDAREDF